jgi:cell division protein FtsI (penicillin-binding protein 3)
MMTRTQFLKYFLLFCLLGIMGRLLYLHFSERHFLRKVAASAYDRREKETMLRGVITDRQGSVIAVSTPMYDIWINPKHFNFSRDDFKELCRMLDLNSKQEIERLRSKQNEYFVYLKRQVPPKLWAQVKALHVPGIYADLEQKRFYPDGEVLSQLLGFVNIDGSGQEGIELEYNDWLSGKAGSTFVQKDLKGYAIAPATETSKTQEAKSLALSIDRRIQFLVYESLKAEAIKSKADAGSAIVLDLQTGEVLAMANYPSFNPNDRTTMDPGESRNRAITDTFEPGSVIKPFAAIAALREKKFKLSDEIDTSPGYVKIGKNLVRDHENYGKLTLEGVLQKSSNVGITYVVTRISPEALPTLLRDVGFGKSWNIHFPGEESGTFPSRKEWPPFTLATMSFGYGFSTTLLHLTQAYSVIGNKGLLRQPTLLRIDNPMPAHSVIDEEYANIMLQSLVSVVSKGGTAVRGDLDNYQVSGKTGTARKVVNGQYATNAYHAFFVGIAPLSHPRVVMAVMIDNPRGKLYYGGDVAAPVFKDSMDQILPLLKSEVDKQPKTHKTRP